MSAPGDVLVDPEAMMDAQSDGELVEVTVTETVDGDLNGAPQLAGLDESSEWQAADAVDAMERSGADVVEGPRTTTERLERQIAERREVLLERASEASALGLGPLFDAVAAASDERAGPAVADDDLLRERLAELEAALSQLEAARDLGGPA